MKYFFSCSLFCTLVNSFVFAQQHEITYICKIGNENEKQLANLSDSLELPLMIYNNTVFVVASECFSRNGCGNANNRNSGGKTNDRNSGGDANDRNSGGDVNDRNSGGSANDRNSGGNVNNRNSGGASENRNDGGNANNRNSGGETNNRNAGGASLDFTCSEKKGKLIIYFHNIKPDKTVKVYYKGKLYTSKDSFFKLKKS